MIASISRSRPTIGPELARRARARPGRARTVRASASTTRAAPIGSVVATASSRVDRLSAGDERRGERLLEQVDRLVGKAPLTIELVGEVEQDVERVVGDGDAARSSRARRGRS